jgi:hypothetical protein
MSHSSIIHSSLVNPAKAQNIKEMQDQQDYVSMDIPLLIRLFELVREDVKSDQDLHDLVERILSVKNMGILSMDQYDKIASEYSGQAAELESIRKLAGIK